MPDHSKAEPGNSRESFPLLPTQLKHIDREHVDYYATCRFYEARRMLQPERVKQTIGYLLQHHDALRLKFLRNGTDWCQFISEPDEAIPFTHTDLSHLLLQQQDDEIQTMIENMLTSLDLAHGPILRVALFECGDQRPQQLLFILHHLATDHFSWMILIQDFLMLYEQLSDDQTVQLPARTTSLKQYVERVMDYMHSPLFQQEIDFWGALAWEQIVPLPVDKPGARDKHALHEGNLHLLSMSLSVTETQALLQKTSQSDDIQVIDILLTAICMAVNKWTGSPDILLETTKHGRDPMFEDVDLTRTVGWLNVYFTIMLHLEDISSPFNALRSIRSQLRAIPNGGIGYGLLRYFEAGDIARRMEALPLPLYVNYYGVQRNTSSNSLLRPAWGKLRTDPNDQIHQLIKCEGGIEKRQLKLDWVYNEDAHSQSTIARLVEEFRTMLLSIVLNRNNAVM